MMRRTKRQTVALVLALASGSLALADGPSVPRILLDRQLRARAVQLRSVDRDTITYLDEKGLVRSERTSEFAAILEAPGAGSAQPSKIVPSESHDADAEAEAGNEVQPPAAPPAPKPQQAPAIALIIDLVDRQRLIGALVPGASSADSITIRHAIFGDVRLAIDQVRGIRPKGAEAPGDRGEEATGDVVVLNNGDRISGVIESIAGTLKLTGKGGTREIPMERVQRIALANPAQPAQGLMAWLGDGSIVRCEELRTTRLGDVELRTTLGSEAAPIPLEDIAAIAFHAESLAALAELDPPKIEPAPGRRWSPGPRLLSRERVPLDLAEIELRGPAAATWSIPPKASRFSARIDLPREAWTWGNASVRVLADGRELAACALSGESPSCSVSVAIDRAEHLSIVIDSGEFGPVENRIVLRAAMLLVSP